MTETIRGLVEVVDAGPGPDFVGCLESRTVALSSFEGLGAVDLCRLRKRVRPLWSSGGGGSAQAAASAGGAQRRPSRAEVVGEELIFFHYVVGLDVADTSSVAQYISAVMAAQEPGTWLSSMLGRQIWRICGGIYCCYDAFSRSDIRVEVRCPGNPGLSAWAVQPDGHEVPVTRQLWEGAQLSSILRALQPRLPRLPSLRVLPLFAAPGSTALDSFVRLATKFFERGDELGVVPESANGTNVLCEFLCGFLVRSRRLSLALEVLPSLQSLYPAVSLYIANAYAKRGQTEAALGVLIRALRSSPTVGALLRRQAKLLLQIGSAAASVAVDAAQLAVMHGPGEWGFWVTLAKACSQAGRHSACLAALNAPALSAADAEEAAAKPELGVPDFSKAEQTAPKDGAVQSSPLAMRPVDFEVLFGGGATPGSSHPGFTSFAGFGPSFGLQPGLDDTTTGSTNPLGGTLTEREREELTTLEGSHGAALSVPERAAFDVLVSLYRKLGWDGLLEQRSKIFLIEEDEDPEQEEEEPEELLSQARIAFGDERQRFPRRLCTPFLDRLFETLHTDLSSFSAWCQAESSNTGKLRGSCELWMHRGALADRLQQDTRAEVAFRLCQARGVCPHASLRLLRIYCRRGRAKEAVAQLAVLCGMASPSARPDDPRPWAASGGWPDWLFDIAARLVCAFGLSGVYAAAGSLPEACFPYRFALAELVRATEAACVDGYQR